MQSFGKWLFDRRKAAGFTQGQLAAKAGISTSYVSTLEREERHHLTNALPQPAKDVVTSIAKALGVPIDDARLAAGYAAIQDTAELIQISDGVTIRFEGSKNWSDQDRERAIDAMRTIIAGIEARKTVESKTATGTFKDEIANREPKRKTG